MKLNSASWIALTVVVFATLAEVAQAAPLVNDAGGLDLETVSWIITSHTEPTTHTRMNLSL